MHNNMKTVIIGLGNPFLTDDSVGIRVSQELKKIIKNENIRVVEMYAGGIRLLDELENNDFAILIDSIKTETGKPGDVYQFSPSDFDSTNNVVSLHDMNLSTALNLGNMINLHLPEEIKIWGIEGVDFNNFGTKLTPEVEYAIPKVVNDIINELNIEYNFHEATL